MPQRINVPGMGVVEFPDGMNDDQIAAAIKSNMPTTVTANAPQGFAANALDFVKSIPRGIVSGLTSAPNPSMVPTGDEEAAVAPTRAQATQTLQAQTPEPQGRYGKLGEAVGQGVGNPVSYLGPGGLGLKIGGAVASSLASEGSRQAAEGTPYEKPAAIAGAIAGGAVAGKTLGPTNPKAAVPTMDELLAAGSQGYKTARNSGLEVKPGAMQLWALRVEKELKGPDHGFTGGNYGTANKTLDLVDAIQRPPKGTAAIAAPGLDTIRKNLQNIAEETQPAQGGFAKPTPDAAAATIALRRFNEYTEAIPGGDVLAGSAKDYVRALKQANSDWGAGRRLQDFETRLTKAERATDRQVAGSLDSQIKSKAGALLDNKAKVAGLSAEEKAQLELINSGGPVSNTLRQLGRGGAGVVPIMGQLAAAGPLAAATGGASIIPQAALAAGLYGARKGSEAITKSRANTLAEMLAKRSAEYERRVAELPAVDSMPNKAALLRALLSH